MGKSYLFCFLLLSSVYADVFHATLDKELDLGPILGIPWKLVAAPEGAVEYRGCHFLTPDSGIATFIRNGVSQLAWYRAGEWEYIPLVDGNSFSNAFLFDMNSFCAVQNEGRPYKADPVFYDRGKWTTIPAPNPDRILSLFFESRNKGWAACESSRLLHWNGEYWTDLYTDVAEHYGSILPFHDKIYSKIKHGKELIVHDLTTNQLDKNHNSIEYNFLSTLFSLGHEKNYTRVVQSENVQLLPSDTIYVSITERDTPIVWACTESGTLLRAYLGIFRTDYNNLEDDFLCVFAQGSETSGLYTNYALLTLDKKCKPITIIRDAPPEPLRLFNIRIRYNDESSFCFADLNKDGTEDFYIISTGEANKLLISIKDTPTYANAYIEMAEKAGVQGGAYVYEGRVNYDSDALVADLDEDGDQDIFVVSLYAPNEFFRQYKKLKFREDAWNSHVLADSGRSLSVFGGDVNNDGALDLLICNTQQEHNHFYRNNGAGIFENITERTGLPFGINGVGWQLADFDNDNDLDLFASQFKLPDRFFLNDLKHGKAHFREITNWRADVDSLFFTCASTAADFDNDGDLDLFCCRSGYSNVMYENDGIGHFTDVSHKTNMGADLITNQSNAFDIDNDGLLDLYVANRRNAKIYKNLGDFRFQDLELHYIYYEKAYPGTAVAADWDNDGDIDLLIEDAFEKSLQCRNETNNNRFIKLKLYGCKSNRDAIGAQVRFYDAGFLGDPKHCRGLRVVSGGHSKSGKNSRIIHLGLADEQPRDALVRFPSGIIKKVENIQPASTISVYEQDGFSRSFSLCKKRVISTIKYPPNQRDAAVFFLFLVMLCLSVYFFTRQFPLAKKMRKLIILLSAFAYLFLFSLLYNNHSAIRHLVPLFSGTTVFLFVFWTSAKIYQREMEQPELIEKLYFKTSAFFHGEWGATRLNRLQLFCSNADEETVNDPEFRRILNEVINNYYTLITPEIDSILAIIKNAHGFQEHYQVCRTQHRQLLKQLNTLRVAINLESQVESEFAETFKSVAALKAELLKIRTIVSKDFKTDVGAAISAYFLTNLYPKMKIQFQPPAEKMLARIRPSEFSQIFDNLVKNAERAMLNCESPQLLVTCEANLDHVNLCISDNGPGIPLHVREKLFKEQISTRKKSGGFGLFYTAQVLKKYNATISINEMQTGASLLMQLRRIQDEQA